VPPTTLGHKQYYWITYGTSFLHIILKNSEDDVRLTQTHQTFWIITNEVVIWPSFILYTLKYAELAALTDRRNTSDATDVARCVLQQPHCWLPWTAPRILAATSSSLPAGPGTRNTSSQRTGAASVHLRCLQTNYRSSLKVTNIFFHLTRVSDAVHDASSTEFVVRKVTNKIWGQKTMNNTSNRLAKDLTSGSVRYAWTSLSVGVSL
jgi:hypothetical protein